MKIIKTALAASTMAAMLIGCADREESRMEEMQPPTAEQAQPSPMQMPEAPMEDMAGDIATQGQEHLATGTITAVEASEAKLTLAHGPVSSLSWPAMTMSFQMVAPATLDSLQVGDKVRFSFVQGEGNQYVITDITRM